MVSTRRGEALLRSDLLRLHTSSESSPMMGKLPRLAAVLNEITKTLYSGLLPARYACAVQ